jgi:hypothetical protein
VDFEIIPNGCEKYKVSSSMVGETWIYVFYYRFSCPPNFRHCWITKWNENDFFKNLILINLWKCHLQSNYLKFWDWLNDLEVDCKIHINFTKFIEMDVNLKEDLEKFEGVLVWNEVVKLWKFWKKLLVLYFHQNLNFFDFLKI